MATMLRNAPLMLIGVLALVFILATFAKTSESPFIVVHKKVGLSELNSGTKRMSVVIDIYNRGSAVSFVSHSFEFESNLKTIYYGAPALIKFRVPTKSRLQEAYSTPILPLDILADRTSDKKFKVAKWFLAKYGYQISAVALFAHLIATPSKSSAAKGRKKRHRV